MKEHWTSKKYLTFLLSEIGKSDTVIRNSHYLSVKGVITSQGVFPKYS